MEKIQEEREKTIEELYANARPHKLKLRKGAPKINPVIANWIEDIIEGKTIEKWEGILNEKENENFRRVLNEAANYLASDDLDKFVEIASHLFDADGKKQLWERNHVLILNTIARLTKEYNRFPARVEISQETQLSRATINKHLKLYFEGQEQQEKQEEYLLMREKVLSTVFNCAKAGDMRAAKVFLDATANQQPSMKIKNQQNNFIQINGTTITEEQLKQLPEDQQLQLQQIVTQATKITVQ